MGKLFEEWYKSEYGVIPQDSDVHEEVSFLAGMLAAAEIAENTKVGHRGGDAVYGKLLTIQAIRKAASE